MKQSVEVIIDQTIRTELEKFLVPAQQLRRPEGVQTGVDALDDFLLWRGLPKGDLSLFCGQPGTGATSLWLQAARKTHDQNKWAAWINSDWELLPSHLMSRGLNLKRLLVVKRPSDLTKMFWILQELISSSLFDLVGCHLPESLLKHHQLKKLKRLARTHQVALVIISHVKNLIVNPIFSLVIDCQRDFFTIKRALHRPTPFTLEARLIHTCYLPNAQRIPALVS